jgi:hypothetical protein
VAFRLSKNRVPCPGAGEGHVDLQVVGAAPRASVAPLRRLSRLRRYRVGNCTFVTLSGEGNLPTSRRFWARNYLEPSSVSAISSNLLTVFQFLPV